MPEHFWGGVSRRVAISSVRTFTFTFVLFVCVLKLIVEQEKCFNCDACDAT